MRIAAAILISLPFVATPALAEEDECSVPEPALLVPTTSIPSIGLPNPPTENDCEFYNTAWHFFLYVTQSSQGKGPDFLSYRNVEDLIGPGGAKDFPIPPTAFAGSDELLILAPRGAKQFSSLPGLGGGFTQAGDVRAVLIDQNRNAVYYGIHLDDTFIRFARDNRLDDPARILKPPSSDPNENDGAIAAELEFRSGAVELKSAWRIVEGQVPTNYITAKALIPWIKNKVGGVGVEIDQTHEPREVTVALLSLHVVVVLDGHPEFVWATFEHADVSDPTLPEGMRDVAPAAKSNPSGTEPVELADPHRNYALYQKGLDPQKANDAKSADTISIDEVSQKFAEATSVYRVFPGSRSDSPEEDEEVVSLNADVGRMFSQLDPNALDPRRNYRLVGAVWIDQPRADFAENKLFADEVLAGENRISNVAMESFTQNEEDSPNCFRCHFTRSKRINNTINIPPRRINVSHITSLLAAAAK